MRGKNAMAEEKRKAAFEAAVKGNSIIPYLDSLFKRDFKLVPCGADKKAIRHAWNTEPITSMEEATATYPDAPKWGVVCGVTSGVTVIDIDPAGMETLAAWESDYGPFVTLRARTPRGGNHLYFQYVPGIKNGVGGSSGGLEGIDTRNDNGYVIAAPSPGYQWIEPLADILEMPGWLREELDVNGYFKVDRPEPPTVKPDQPDPLETPRSDSGKPEGTRYANAALKKECDRVKMAVEGTRNSTLNTAAFSLFQLVAGGELPEAIVTEKLTEAARTCGLDDDEIARTIASGKKGGERVPRKTPEKKEVVFKTCDLLSQNMTEAGNGERFAAYSNGNARYIHKFKQWATWDGRRWELDESGGANAIGLKMIQALHAQIAALPVDENNVELRKHLFRWAMKSENRKELTNSIYFAQHPLKMHENDFDAHPYLINFRSGTLDLRNQSFRQHNREDYLTQMIDYDYLPTARADRWESFLYEIFSGRKELIRFIQKAVGYSLTGSYQERCIFILYGTGKNGKSTFLNVLTHILGEYAGGLNADALMIQKYSDDKFLDFAALRAARFVTSSESEDNKRLAESKIKQLSGGDRLQARFLHQNFFSFTPQFKIWLATNHLPVIRGTDDAIWDRIRLIPFDFHPKWDEVDPRLTEKLLAEAEGILSWAVEGARLWRKEELEAPEAVKRATADYRAESDHLSDFLDAATENTVYPTRYVTKAKLYEMFCAENGDDVFRTQTAFSKAMREKGFSTGRTTGGERVWIGLTVKQNSQQSVTRGEWPPDRDRIDSDVESDT